MPPICSLERAASRHSLRARADPPIACSAAPQKAIASRTLPSAHVQWHHFQLRVLRRLSATHARARIDEMLDAVDFVTDGKGSRLFVFTDLATLLANDPLGPMWIDGKRETTGQPPPLRLQFPCTPSRIRGLQAAHSTTSSVRLACASGCVAKKCLSTIRSSLAWSLSPRLSAA